MGMQLVSVGLPEEMHNAGPKRLRFLVGDAVGKVVRHVARALADAA